MLIGYLAQTLNSSMAVWLLCVGFCGGFTTFSTFSADFIRLVRAGNTTGALLYVAATVAVCALATVAGARIAVATGR